MREDFNVVNRRPSPEAPPRPMQAIKCSACREEDFISAHNGRAPASTIAAKFRKAGWFVGDVGKHLCPGCAGKRRGALHSGGSAMLKTTMTPALDDTARRALPILYVALEDKYDRETKAYRDGATDASIAAELHLPVAIVAERRTTDFGPLVESEAARRKRETEAARRVAQAVLDVEQRKLVVAANAVADAVERVRNAAVALAATFAERAA